MPIRTCTFEPAISRVGSTVRFWFGYGWGRVGYDRGRVGSGQGRAGVGSGYGRTGVGLGLG